jgi:hypothetical protein
MSERDRVGMYRGVAARVAREMSERDRVGTYRLSVTGVAAGGCDARIEIRGGLRTSVECLDTGVARPRRFPLDWREPGSAKYEPVLPASAFPFDDRGFAHVPLPAGVIDVRFRDPSEPHREVEILGLHVHAQAPHVKVAIR